MVLLKTETMTWVQGNPIGEQPPERTYHATARVGRNLIVVGGKREGVILKDVWLLQGLFHTLSFIISILSSSCYVCFFFFGINGVIIVANVTEKICWWKVTGSQPSPRAHHSLVRTDSRLFLLGGKGSGNSLLDEIWSTNTGMIIIII